MQEPLLFWQYRCISVGGARTSVSAPQPRPQTSYAHLWFDPCTAPQLPVHSFC